jgi:hypothetical protein
MPGPKCPHCFAVATGRVNQHGEPTYECGSAGASRTFACQAAEIERLRADCEIEQLQARLQRLSDYGLGTARIDDKESLWSRIDEFRGGKFPQLTEADQRDLAEWWAELHTTVCELDEKLANAKE